MRQFPIIPLVMDPQQEALLKKYVDAVLAAPAHLHLTSDRDFQTFWSRHVEDAIKLRGFIPPHLNVPALRVLDVGSGNGLPGIPISIMEPSWSVDFVDSDNKKCGFIDMFRKTNSIINARVFCGRAETFAHGVMRASYSTVYARALSKIPVSLELSAAFVQTGGVLIVPHGTSWEADFKDGGRILKLLGLSAPTIHKYRLAQVEYTALV